MIILVDIINNIKTLMGYPKPQASSPEPPKYHHKILVVEDEAALANALELELQESGYSVKKASNGMEGLELVQTFQPNLIILDLLMPVMDGISMLSKLRKIPLLKYLPVIILTNAGDADNIRRTVVYSDADVFLIKSNITPAEVVVKVKELL